MVLETTMTEYNAIDLFFAQMYSAEKRMRKMQKDVARIRSVLSPQEQAHLASELEPVRGMAQEIIKMVQLTPPNPNVPERRPITRKQRAKILHELFLAKRARWRIEPTKESAEQIARERRLLPPPQGSWKS
jgi:hypothetical protein